MGTTDMQESPIETLEIMAFPTDYLATVCLDNGVLNGIPKVLDSWGRLKEFSFNLFALSGVTSNNLSNLSVTCTILLYSLGVANP